MDRRRLVIFIAINIFVSAVVTLLVLSWWQAQQPAASIPTPIATAEPARAAAPTGTSAPTSSPAPSPSPVPTSTPTPSGPIAYRVQQGDTLSSLSVRFNVPLQDVLTANKLRENAILSVGQELIIPIGGLTSLTPTPAATVAATAGPAFVTIREIRSAGSIDAEMMILTNLGGVINLEGWTLTDGNNRRYAFPYLTLGVNAEINLHTKAGTNTPSDLYMGESEARWGKKGTVAYLRDASGKLVATYRVP
jgi:LysM repeat protein